ncbi:MAG: porphobilinogen synthase [Bdellovibrionales bacterium]|nr:porphobilinogen synthase [Bdellovibrionales bacterium]
MFSLPQRPRRNRKSAALRDMLQETYVLPRHLVFPAFICANPSEVVALKSLPGQQRWLKEDLAKLAEDCLRVGVRGLALFPFIENRLKDSHGSESKNRKGLVPEAVRLLKEKYPDLIVFTDVALDPYSSDGHDGLVQQGEVLNDESLPLLADMALTQAQAGADWVCASDMMDGRIGFLRKTLDEGGYSQTNILSYSSKYASSFYGPFREALDSAPREGDKRTYQMNPANRREARRELKLDQWEGADMLMIKPALPYLDIIADYRRVSALPIAAYNVSGEYAMLKAAAERGWLEEDKAIDEVLTSIKRAGADVIFSYHALEWSKKFKPLL